MDVVHKLEVEEVDTVGDSTGRSAAVVRKLEGLVVTGGRGGGKGAQVLVGGGGGGGGGGNGVKAPVKSVLREVGGLGGAGGGVWVRVVVSVKILSVV